jgi:hypothetical protein
MGTFAEHKDHKFYMQNILTIMRTIITTTRKPIMTLTLSSRPRQGHGNVRAGNVTWESHSHSWVSQP